MKVAKIAVSDGSALKTFASPKNSPRPRTRRTRAFASPCALLLVALAAEFCPSTTQAQVIGARIDKVWEFLINKPGILLPTLTNSVADTADNDNGDGHYPMDSLAGLKRYDTNRLVLGIRENGITKATPI
jgi:hypothetical protein